MKTAQIGSTPGMVIPVSYAPLVAACAAHGIGRTKAFELASTGQVDTVKIGSRTFVMLDSLASLPNRLRQMDGLRQESGTDPIRPVIAASPRRAAAAKAVRS